MAFRTAPLLGAVFPLHTYLMKISNKQPLEKWKKISKKGSQIAKSVPSQKDRKAQESKVDTGLGI